MARIPSLTHYQMRMAFLQLGRSLWTLQRIKFPVALEQNIQTQQGATSKYVLTGIPTSSPIDSVTQGNYGSVEILDKDSVKYTHTGFRDASDIFTYTVRDEFGAKASGNVNVVVEITNSVPINHMRLLFVR